MGEEPTKSAPSLTLSNSLTRLGVAVRFAPVDQLRRLEWLRILRSAKAIVLVYYGVIDAYRLSQLATAVALKVPIVRWWVGTDVLNVITRDEVRKNAVRLDRIVSVNVAVASHLVDELATAGLYAKFVPSVLDPHLIGPEMVEWGEKLKPVIVYMPGGRKEFFGLNAIEPVITANPDIKFIVIADDTHALASHPNVESLGWVSDMNRIYPRAGCVLRITAHDGLPRMLMEGLLHGLYAIYSWPLQGCWEARSTEEIETALSRYRATTAPNVAGRTAMLAMLAARPDLQIAKLIDAASVPLVTRGHAFALALRTRLFSAQIT